MKDTIPPDYPPKDYYPAVIWEQIRSETSPNHDDTYGAWKIFMTEYVDGVHGFKVSLKPNADSRKKPGTYQVRIDPEGEFVNDDGYKELRAIISKGTNAYLQYVIILKIRQVQESVFGSRYMKYPRRTRVHSGLKPDYRGDMCDESVRVQLEELFYPLEKELL